jgi:prepilin-type N-terminal cleavage/methylation domain-containing protein
MRKGFTLIELLVVVSIIALLIAILLPVLGAARKTAIQAQCLSQTRSLAQATFTYLADNKYELPQRLTSFPHRVADAGGDDLNVEIFKPYLGISITTGPADRQGDETLFCPGDLYEARNPSVDIYKYGFITYQFFSFEQGHASWTYTENGSVFQPNTEKVDPIVLGQYPLWGDLCVISQSGGQNVYLGHDAASTLKAPSGMNASYGDGSGGWTPWSECGSYFERGVQQYIWPKLNS